MNETHEQRLDTLHNELAALYRAGLLHTRPNDDARLTYYWLRIFKIEDVQKREALADQAAIHRAVTAAADGEAL